jgi:predicted O-methyltransferase YrrM
MSSKIPPTAPTSSLTPPPHAVEGATAAFDAWQRGAPPNQGFYIPYRYAQACAPRQAPSWLLEALTQAHSRMHHALDAARKFSPRLRDFASGSIPSVPRFDQDWFTGLDATLAYTLVRDRKPRRIVEIGSGHSTRFMAQAVEDSGTDSHLTSIDPEPRKAIDALCDALVRDTLGNASLSCIETLQAGDILFVDSSHIAMPGSDVEQLCVEIIPRLKDGVLLHVHDLLLPDPYPEVWRWRGYNEQAMIAALIGAGRLRIECASAYISRHQPDWLESVFCPAPANALISSMWFSIA